MNEIGAIDRQLRTGAGQNQAWITCLDGQFVEERDRVKERFQLMIPVRAKSQRVQNEVDLAGRSLSQWDHRYESEFLKSGNRKGSLKADRQPNGLADCLNGSDGTLVRLHTHHGWLSPGSAEQTQSPAEASRQGSPETVGYSPKMVKRLPGINGATSWPSKPSTRSVVMVELSVGPGLKLSG